jgi:hypothetical protein
MPTQRARLKTGPTFSVYVPAVKCIRYHVFGLSLRSNLSIPAFPSSNAPDDAPEVRLHLGVFPDLDHYSNAACSPNKLTYISSYTDETGEPALRVSEAAGGALLHLAYSGGTQFWLDRTGTAIWAVWSERSSLENAVSYLLGPVLGLVLRLRGVVSLHASAVAFDDSCVAFVGSAGAGKSTTAAAFAQQGYGIVSDDIVGLVERHGSFYVLPAYPHLCLWPESVSMLYGSPDALPQLVHGWEKRQLALGENGTRFEQRTLPLSAIYILGARLPDTAPSVNSIQDREVLLSLVANTYATNLIDRTMRGKEFDLLSRLVSSVPVRTAHPSYDPSRMGDLCRLIQSDFDTHKK